MERPKEKLSFYASDSQREVLMTLISHPSIEESFFLTGGTALAAFYLYHRVSDDLDFFSLDTFDFTKIDLWIRSSWTGSCTKTKEGPNFLSFLIQDTKVEFVIDPLSNKERRQKMEFENDHSLTIDNISNIFTNKLCTIVSRSEPKDFVDFFFLAKDYPAFKIDDLYRQARLKDAIFDDPPTAAFQLEEGLKLIQENPSVLPEVKRDLDKTEFSEYFEKIVRWIYHKITIE